MGRGRPGNKVEAKVMGAAGRVRAVLVLRWMASEARLARLRRRVALRRTVARVEDGG
jgi:hypothetical protein